MSTKIFEKPTVVDKINKLYEKTVALGEYDDFDFYTLIIADYAGIHTPILKNYFCAQKKANLALLELMRAELTVNVYTHEESVLSGQALANLFLQLVCTVQVIQEICTSGLILEEENEDAFTEVVALSRIDNIALDAAEYVPTLVRNIGRILERVEKTQDCEICQNHYEVTIEETIKENPLKTRKDLPSDVRKYLDGIKK